jgi:glucan phosphoethanolaminetransferase (alkaline phosphatase superfamily)
MAQPYDDLLTDTTDNADSDKQMRLALIIGGVVIFTLFALIVVASIWMVKNPDTTETLRDVFIIWIALISLLIGIALVVLMVQLARLINLIQNEIKPILENTNDTLRTVKGTAQFVSQNVTDPVVKISSTLAGVQHFFSLLVPGKPRRK